MKKRAKYSEADREKALYAKWYYGRLDYKLRPEQRKLKKLLEAASNDLNVFNISRRFGKTTTCVTFADEQARRKKQIIKYATAFLTDLEGFVLPIFEWLLMDCPQALKPRYKPSKKEWHYHNGSVIKLIGVDKNPNALRGTAVDLLVVDEASFVKNLGYIYKSVIVPATMKRKFKLIFPSTPPESPEHFWASELIPKAKERKSYVELTIDQISDLDPKERKRLLDEVGGEFSPTAQREFFCKIIADAERAISPVFNRAIHVQEYSPDLTYWQAFGDAGGVRDKTVVLKVTWCHRYQKIIVRDEIVFDNKTPSQLIVDGIKAKFPGLPLAMDASGQTLVDYASLGLPAMLPKKEVFEAGIQMLNTCFHNNEIIIHPACEFLIRSLEGALLNRQRTDFERSDALGHADAIAALIYAIRMVDRRDYFPEIDRLDRSRYHVTEAPKPVEAELSKLFGGML